MADDYDFLGRLKEAGLMMGDTINRAGGGSNNMYGVYVEQKSKREQMEREAEAARQKQLYEQTVAQRQAQMQAYNRSIQSMASSPVTRKNVIGFDPATGMNVLEPNPNYDEMAAKASTSSDLVSKEIDIYSKKNFLPIDRKSLIGMSPIDRMNYLKGDFTTRGKSGTRYELSPDERRRTLKNNRDTLLEQGGKFYTDESNSIKSKTGFDFIESAKALKLKPKTDEMGRMYYDYPPGQSKENIEKLVVENKKKAQNLETQIKRANTLYTQFNKALEGVDKEQRDAWLQRGVGWWEKVKAKTGFGAKADLVALMNNQREMAIAILRAAGEVGALNEAEAKEAIASVQLEKKTPEERAAIVKQKLELAIAGANEDTLAMLLENKDKLQPLLNAFDIDLDNIGKSYTTDDKNDGDQYSSLAKQKGVTIRFK